MRSPWLEPDVLKGTSPVLRGGRHGDVSSLTRPIEAIFLAIRYKPKFVLDADISQCFDRIDHKALLTKLNTFPTIRRQIRAWLKAGVMDNKQLHETSEGTPQGGVISPLLANIALHGMEERIKQVAETLKGKRENNRKSLTLIRYADDFVILHKDITVVQRCQQVIAEWLKGMGLELKPSKTRLTHTLDKYGDNEPGFDFLGFNVRQFPAGKYTSGMSPKKQLLGFKTIITPSSQKVKVHYQKIASIINAHKSAPQVALIRHLNPTIIGWANYYSTQASKKTYVQLGMLVYRKLRVWAKRRHHNKGEKWIANKYWQTIDGDNWVFATKQTAKNPMRLNKHSATPIVRHVKVRSEASPFDGNLIYWSSRMGTHPEASIRMSSLLKKQKGKCIHCELYFREEDVLEIDHITPKNLGGKDEYKNLQILHRHCHDMKTTEDGSVGGTHDKAPYH